MPPASSAALTPRTYAWWLVLGLVGLDCFSTLGYLPTIAVEGAKEMAPLAAVTVSLLILFAALPVYLYVVGRSPHGRGATGLLESHLSGWGGKLFILFLLGFVATDFVMTRALSTADASKHLLANEYTQSGLVWLLDRKDVIHDALPSLLQGWFTDRVFAWWDEQLIVAVILTILGFALYFFLLRGFSRAFLYSAAFIVALFLFVNALVIGSCLVYVARHSEYMTNWMELVGFASRNEPPFVLFIILAGFALYGLPALVLGLSGFELSMAVAPLVRGRPDDDPIRPRGRIRNMRKLLVAVAVLMAVLVPASVASVKFLVPREMMAEDRPARHRALAYLAHGGVLHLPGKRVGTDKPLTNPEELMEEMNEAAPPQRQVEQQPQAEQPDVPAKEMEARLNLPTGADLNPLFGPAFGTLYDLSAVLILVLAGASVTISLRDLLPQYLTRYGMEMHWAHRIGVLLHSFNLIVLIVVIAFHASVAQQQGAYATSVLVLLAVAALAAAIDLRSRWRASRFRLLVAIPFIFIFVFFWWMSGIVSSENSAGSIIALLFVAVLFISAGVSRWRRSTELRYDGFTFADEESGIRWEQIRRLEFQVLAPHRPDHLTLAEKDADLRARHRLGPDVSIIFIEAMLGDPSDFQQHPLMRIVRQDGMEVIRVSAVRLDRARIGGHRSGIS